MSLKEPTHTTGTATRPRWLWIAVVVAVIAGLAIAAYAIWTSSGDEGPVAAEDAQIELTYTGDEATYSGDREIVAGSADVVFSNESDRVANIVVQRFDTGSAELAAELAPRPEGSDFDAEGMPPGEVALMEEIGPASRTWRITLEPGTYFIEAAYAGDENTPTHVWRTAVIEVVPG